MIDILKNIMNIAARIHDMQLAGTLSMILFGAVLAFGVVNCVLGYRLLRFWMMLFGFLIGAAAGLFGVSQLAPGNKMYYIAGMIGVGLVLAVISFAVFKAGIFIIGAGIGLTITIYVLHPTTSFTFFLCLLAGVGLGILALRYEREVIIVGTSILGGILSGFATVKLAKMEEIPFAIIFSVGFALIGMLIQFAINKPKYEDEEEDEEKEDDLPRRKRDRKVSEAAAKSAGGENLENRKKKDLEYAEDPDDLSEADDEEIDEILDEYGVDEEDVIEEYLEDYYGENKKQKRRVSASPYQNQKRRK